MRLTRAADYGLRVLIELAQPDRVGRTTRANIIKKTGVPAAFLNKLIQRLVHAGFLVATPGVRGGCLLAKPASAISILEVIEAIDGPLELSECLAEGAACPHCSKCQLRRLLTRLQTEMARILGTASVADLVDPVDEDFRLIPLTARREESKSVPNR